MCSLIAFFSTVDKGDIFEHDAVVLEGFIEIPTELIVFMRSGGD